jgi:hypothetical protein
MPGSRSIVRVSTPKCSCALTPIWIRSHRGGRLQHDRDRNSLCIERAAAAEACLALGHPEHIRAFVVDGYDAAGVRQALAGTPPAPAAPARPALPRSLPQRAANPTGRFGDGPEYEQLAAAAKVRLAQAGRAPA